ncbi:MAG: excinuclease ABC subunit UvrA, partial [Akkermansiaceae bacterium]|nr:excinuclease ABC subunit UvrA [Verrucomicrobiales bacterium]
DTIYAEGQRKYVESLSAYARQFLDQMQKPEVDYIEGLSPAIAIEQRTSGMNPRSTVATTTEIYDYLRLLYAHVGQAHCPDTGEPIVAQTTSDIVDKILALPERTKVMLLAPVVRGEKGEFRDVIERLQREGFVRARVDGELVELTDPNVRVRLDAKQSHTIEAVVDRLVMEEKVRVRLQDSVETAIRWGQGIVVTLHQLALESKVQSPKSKVGEAKADAWIETLHSNRMYSPGTGKSYEKPTPKHFSFNSPNGACPVCHGLGQKMIFDEGLVVPDADKSLESGTVLPWRRGGKRMIVYYKAMLKAIAGHFEKSMETPYKNLPEDFKHVLMHGSGETEISFQFWRAGKVSTVKRVFEGVLPNMERLYAESESEFTRNRLKAFMSPQFCDACCGKRLRPEILAVTLSNAEFGVRSAESQAPGVTPHSSLRTPRSKIPGLSIMDVCLLSVNKADEFFSTLKLTEFQLKIAGEVIKEIRARLGFLKNVGLGYLTLNRESGSLSGGEAQRIRLATQIGAGLVGVLYILDEPSIGLHQRDNDRLLETLKGLRDLGNSVLVVEHDADTIQAADYILDLGPGAGVHGGEVVASGTLQEVLANKRSLTGRYLTGDMSIPLPKERKKPSVERGTIEIVGASENNLKNVNARIPIGLFTCVTGVSGSGKSTLVDDTLRRALMRKFYGSKERPGAHKEIKNYEGLEKIVVIDQTAIGRTPRSNPATYTGMFNAIRDLFAKLPTAKIRGYEAGRFSFNVKGGRCEKCQGDGLIKIEMNFLPPVYVTCENCGGKRYNRETLEIAYKGLNISDVLNLTVDEAVSFFRAVPQIYDPCLTLAEVGLGYIHLGQSGTTLSGGEAQRIKLAAELSRKQTGRTLYILDEPTTGLHFHDVAKLLEVLFKLRASGNTLLIIEHNLDVIKMADWVIDLGPEGGDGGGNIVIQGTPEQVALCAESHTGKYLKSVLKV